jgi:hypothetical protein
MTPQGAEASPGFNARIAGVFYLLVFLTGGVAAFCGRLIVPRDPTATAANILAHEPLFELGFTAWLVVIACYIAVTWLFYGLFKPVNRSISLLAAFFSLVGCAIQGSACLLYVAPLVALGRDQYLSVFMPHQMQAMALLSLRLHVQAYNIGLPFFGFYCLLIGYLVLRSTFLPRIVGVLMVFSGLGWLTFLSPALAHSLGPYNVAPGLLGEGSLTLWLVIRGVRVER